MYEGSLLVTLINEVQILTYYPELFTSYDECVNVMNTITEIASQRYAAFAVSIIPECLAAEVGA